MEGLEVAEHEHPLKLIDLQLEYPPYDDEEEEDGKEGDDPTTEEGFHGVRCGRCREEIHMYHMYYYKCSSCDFSLHKFCAELSTRLENPLHPHPLIQRSIYYEWTCYICRSSRMYGEICYDCSECYFRIDVKCAVELGKNIIDHPCHPHLLMCAIPKPILCECSACGNEHKGIFYQCTTCVGFTIHSDCAFLPKTLLIQHTTDNAFHHTHPLTISYSFPRKDQLAKHNPSCRVCGRDFFSTENLWIYKCDKCLYYAHVDCATSRKEPFMSIVLPPGLGKTIKNFKDADHPHLLHLPFPDETYSIPKHLFFLESDHEVNLTHASHQHPLILVDHTQRKSNGKMSSSWLLTCHDPMKKTQLQCNGCLKPIMSTMPFYKCDQLLCNFALHEWCTRLPPKIENHPFHPQHTLLLKYSNALPLFFGVFNCAVCDLFCNGFTYCCIECGYYVDVSCGFIPKQITHEAHPNHILSIVQNPFSSKYCHMCHDNLSRSSSRKDLIFYSCNHCDIYLHPQCALLLAKTIRHKYDNKHPMHLSYVPIENHKSEYFCEICEQDLNPHASFYHCQHCVQSIHTACAPLIIQCETETYTRYYWRSIYYLLNIKFGGIWNNNGHPHPLSFAQGLNSDGNCEKCNMTLQYEMIFTCLECDFAVHYKCCKKYNFTPSANGRNTEGRNGSNIRAINIT